MSERLKTPKEGRSMTGVNARKPDACSISRFLIRGSLIVVLLPSASHPMR